MLNSDIRGAIPSSLVPYVAPVIEASYSATEVLGAVRTTASHMPGPGTSSSDNFMYYFIPGLVAADESMKKH